MSDLWESIQAAVKQSVHWIKRPFYWADLENYQKPDQHGNRRWVSLFKTTPERANLVGSKLEPKPPLPTKPSHGSVCPHAPVLDIDFPVHAVPSTTPGHYHLYFDKEITWVQYKKLLEALLFCDYIEQGFYDAAMHYGQTLVRPPNVKKGERTLRPHD